MRFYWIQEESSGVLEFDKISSYPAGSAEESQSSANFNEKPQILHADVVIFVSNIGSIQLNFEPSVFSPNKVPRC